MTITGLINRVLEEHTITSELKESAVLDMLVQEALSIYPKNCIPGVTP